MWNLKNNTNESAYKTETDPPTSKTNLWLPQRKWRECAILRVWKQQTQTTLGKTDNKGLLYSTGNYIQYLVITYNERESEKLCIYLNHFAVDMKLKIL